MTTQGKIPRLLSAQILHIVTALTAEHAENAERTGLRWNPSSPSPCFSLLQARVVGFSACSAISAVNNGFVQYLGSGVIAAALFVGGCQTDTLQEAQLISSNDAVALIGAHAGSPSFVLLDVRTPEEFAQGRIAGAILLDYRGANFQGALARLDRSRTYLVYCRTGNRSSYAVRIMAEMGFAHVYDRDGGIMLWQAEGLPMAP